MTLREEFEKWCDTVGHTFIQGDDYMIAKAYKAGHAAGLEKARTICDELAKNWWAEYDDRQSIHCKSAYLEGRADGAEGCVTQIIRAKAREEG